MIDDFGDRIATVWSELRPATRGLVERALQAAASGSQTTRNSHYDARADLELSRFLAALDARAAEKTEALDAETADGPQPRAVREPRGRSVDRRGGTDAGPGCTACALRSRAAADRGRRAVHQSLVQTERRGVSAWVERRCAVTNR